MIKKTNTSGSRKDVEIFIGLMSVILVFAVLYLAKTVLIPLALSILLTFILTPAVVRLEKWKVRRIPAVLGVTIATIVVLLSIVLLIGGQIQSLATDLPNHQAEIRRKVAMLKSGEDSTLNRLRRMFDEVSSDLSKDDEHQDTKPADINTQVPGAVPEDEVDTDAPVETIVVTESAGSPAAAVLKTVLPILEPLATAALVIVLVIFLLISREDVRYRLMSLWGQGALTGTTRLLSDTSNRVSSYLANLFMVNAAFGLWFGAGLYFIGVPYAPLWGFLTLVLRFIPFLGSPASVLFPLLISFATSQGWGEPIAVAVFFGVSELFVANVLEPILFGKTTGLSPIALMVAALFWAWLWGPIGLLLSTPLTVCMVVLGQHIPSLSWLKILLAEQSEMEPWLRYYQRLLSKDPHEAGQLLSKHNELAPVKLFDQILIPALSWTRKERQAGDIDAAEANFVWSTTRQLLKNVETRHQEQNADQANREESIVQESDSAKVSTISQSEESPERNSVANILGYPSHHESEELILTMLGQSLQDNVSLKIASTCSLPNQILNEIEDDQPVAVVIAVLPPGGLPQVEYFCQECRARSPKTSIVVACFGEIEDFDKLLVDLRKYGASYLTTSLEQTKNQLESIADAWRNELSHDTSHPGKSRTPDCSANTNSGGSFLLMEGSTH